MLEVFRALALMETSILVTGTVLFFKQWTKQRSRLLKVRIMALAGYGLQQGITQVYRFRIPSTWYGLPLTFVFTTLAIVGLFGPLVVTGWRVRPLQEMKSYDSLYRSSQRVPDQEE